MPRLITRREMLAAAAISPLVYDRMANRRAVALTYGVERPPTPDRYMSTDPVFLRVVVDMAERSGIAQPVVATLVRYDNRVVLDAIVTADSTPETIGLALVQWADKTQQLIHGTGEQLRERVLQVAVAANMLAVERISVLDITALIATVRRNAAADGIDLGRPLFLAADDERYAAIREELAALARDTKRDLEKRVMKARGAMRERLTSRLTRAIAGTMQ